VWCNNPFFDLSDSSGFFMAKIVQPSLAIVKPVVSQAWRRPAAAKIPIQPFTFVSTHGTVFW
jgi:hypothetical protein